MKGKYLCFSDIDLTLVLNMHNILKHGGDDWKFYYSRILITLRFPICDMRECKIMRSSVLSIFITINNYSNSPTFVIWTQWTGILFYTEVKCFVNVKFENIQFNIFIVYWVRLALLRKKRQFILFVGFRFYFIVRLTNL